MFERFTERARKVVVLAQEEARHFNHNYIGTEHLLLGLLREDEGVAARALTSLNVTLDEVREQVESIVGYGEEGTGGQAPFTPRSKKVLELALREAFAARAQLHRHGAHPARAGTGVRGGRRSGALQSGRLTRTRYAGRSCGCSAAAGPAGSQRRRQ